MEVEAGMMVSSTYEQLALCLQKNYPIVEEENYVKLGEEPGLVSKVNNFRRKIRGGKVTCHSTLSAEIPSIQSTKRLIKDQISSSAPSFATYWVEVTP